MYISSPAPLLLEVYSGIRLGTASIFWPVPQFDTFCTWPCPGFSERVVHTVTFSCHFMYFTAVTEWTWSHKGGSQRDSPSCYNHGGLSNSIHHTGVSAHITYGSLQWSVPPVFLWQSLMCQFIMVWEELCRVSHLSGIVRLLTLSQISRPSPDFWS